jgi:hypothetical protein
MSVSSPNDTSWSHSNYAESNAQRSGRTPYGPQKRYIGCSSRRRSIMRFTATRSRTCTSTSAPDTQMTPSLAGRLMFDEARSIGPRMPLHGSARHWCSDCRVCALTRGPGARQPRRSFGPGPSSLEVSNETRAGLTHPVADPAPVGPVSAPAPDVCRTAVAGTQPGSRAERCSGSASGRRSSTEGEQGPYAQRKTRSFATRRRFSVGRAGARPRPERTRHDGQWDASPRRTFGPGDAGQRMSSA